MSPKSHAEVTYDDVLRAFQTIGARIGAQVGALTIKAFQEAKVGPQPVLYWPMDKAPRELTMLVPNPERWKHLLMVPLAVDPPAWLVSDASNFRMEDGTSIFVF